MASATDIITYIGIPLAVLGVLPILYTCITSLITLRSIKQKLKADGVKPLSINSSLMSGIVEVCLPRFSITPLDRDNDKDYWKLCRRPSELKGGTWTTFNWNTLITGSCLYRLQYSDELQVPKAEIDFEELLSFLMDRGAVPDIKGLRMLRTSGLWTPTGTSLMLSPDTTQKALRVALPDDSDGVLSLTLMWNAAWDNDNGEKLGLGWMSIDGVQLSQSDGNDNDKNIENDLEDETKGPVPNGKGFKLEKPPTQEFAEDGVPADVSYEKPAVEAARPMGSPSKRASLCLRFAGTASTLRISNAIWKFESKLSSTKTVPLQSLEKRPASNWLPPIALSLGLARSFALYNHSLDPSLKILATREIIPCGVVVLLEIISESDAPTWETKYDPSEDHRLFHNKFVAQQRAISAENQMPPDQARIARSKRQADELHAFSNDAIEKRRRDQERHLNRRREAIASPRLDTSAVAVAALKWLIEEKCCKPKGSYQDVMETLVVGGIKGEEQALVVFETLERWCTWNERGGMTGDDLAWLEGKKQAFCSAACVMGLLHEVCSLGESTVAVDIRECVQHWKKVRLG